MTCSAFSITWRAKVGASWQNPEGTVAQNANADRMKSKWKLSCPKSIEHAG